jgi:hypothetical protein
VYLVSDRLPCRQSQKCAVNRLDEGLDGVTIYQATLPVRAVHLLC